MRGPSAGVRAVIFGLLSIVLMTVDQRHHHLESVRSVFSVVVLPLQQAVNAPTLLARWLADNFASRDALLEENRQLKQKHYLINAELQKLTVLEAENRRLRLLLDSAANLPDRTIIAELLNVDDDPYRHRIVVGKGRHHGALVGKPLLDSNGIVGQVLHVGPLSSVALLITDPSHSLPVQVDRNGMRSLAMGTGRFDELDLAYLPNNADIEVGDLLITSALGGRFPRGYPVARVSEVERDPGLPFARVTAVPTAKLDRLREVLLIVPETETLHSSVSEMLELAEHVALGSGSISTP